MVKNQCSILAQALLAAAAAAGLAQPAHAARSDSQVWTNGVVNVKLADKWRLQEEMTGRFSDKRNGLYEFESNTLLGYRLNKVVTLWPAIPTIRNIPTAISRSWSTAPASR